VHSSADHLLSNSIDFTDDSVKVKIAKAKMGKTAYDGDTFFDCWNVLHLFRIDLKLAGLFKR